MIHFGNVYFIEVKTDVGRQSDKQKEFQTLVENQGFKYYLIKSLEKFKEIVAD
jgi:hypothetical protein